jgi:hypothetical protein
MYAKARRHSDVLGFQSAQQLEAGIFAAEGPSFRATLCAFKANLLSTNKDEAQISGSRSGLHKLVELWSVGLLVVAHR